MKNTSKQVPGTAARNDGAVPEVLEEEAYPPTLRLQPEEPTQRRHLRGERARAAIGQGWFAQVWRLFSVYFVTFRVMWSYLLLRAQVWLRSPDAIARIAEEKHRRNARRILRAILKLQGLYIKVGQLISVMTGFLPEAFRRELEGLQDRVPPRPFSDVEARFREEFDGRGPEAMFAAFEPYPVASASMGQVHLATLRDGRRVAVKVQYPELDRIVAVDLKTLKRLFRWMSRLLPNYGMETIYKEVRDMIIAELDFRSEAANITRIAANFRNRPDVRFPRVVDDLSTSRVLTTEWIEGIKVSDRGRLDAAGISRQKLAKMLIQVYCQQIFVDGVYHADPHPGNLMVAPGQVPQVVLLDFGAVGQVSQAMRHGIVNFLQGAFTHDSRQVVEAMKQMGFIAKGADPAVFDRVVEFFHERFQEEIKIDSFSLKDVHFDPQRSLESLVDLRKLDVKLRDVTTNFHVPKEWILLERTVLLLMGLCAELDPDLNPTQVIRPYLEEFVLGKERDWSKFMVDSGKETMLAALALPGEMKRFMMTVQRGELRVAFSNLDQGVSTIYSLGHQFIYAMGVVTSASFWLVLSGRNQAIAAERAMYAAGGFGLCLLLSMWATRNRRRRRR